MSHLRRMDVRYADSANVDAFARLRTAESYGIFDSTFQYDVGPIRYNAITAAGGTVTHLPNESSAQLATIASPGSSAALQSKAYHRYIPGKSQLVVMTFVMGAAVAGVVKRVGYFDASDGVFVEQNGTTDVAFVRRTSTSGAPVDNRVTQANWNLDPLDGTGPSGLTLDLTKAQILAIDLQWLGVGRVRVGFDINGQFVIVHEFSNANNLTLVYMKTANLATRWEIASAAGAVASMKAICAAVVSEGGVESDLGFVFSANNALTPRTFTVGTPLPIIAVRPAATFKGITNRIQLRLESISWLPTNGTNEFLWQIIYNTTVTGGAWAAVNAESSAEVNVTGTAVAGGIVIASGYDLTTAAQRFYKDFEAGAQRYPWVHDVVGNQIPIALVATEFAGSSDLQASMQWRELR